MASCNKCGKSGKSGHKQGTSWITILADFTEEEDMPDYYCSKKCVVLDFGGTWTDEKKEEDEDEDAEGDDETEED